MPELRFLFLFFPILVILTDFWWFRFLVIEIYCRNDFFQGRTKSGWYFFEMVRFLNQHGTFLKRFILEANFWPNSLCHNCHLGMLQCVTIRLRAEFGIFESDILVKNANLIILALKS